METRILNDVAVHGAIIMTKNENGFPENPRIGTLVIKDNALYAYIAIGGMETWYPFGNRTLSYIHVQGLPSLSWIVEHNLGSADIWYQVQNADGEIVQAKVNIVDENNLEVNFTTPITGKVIIVAPTSIDVPEVKATSIEAGNGYVVIDNSGIRIDGSYVLTSGNIEFYAEQAVAAEATARANADATLQSNIDAEATARSNADTTLQNNINAEATARANADTTLQSNIDGKQSLLTYAEISSAALTTSTADSGQVVDSVSASVFRSVKYNVQVTSGTSYHTSEISVVHDDTTTYMTEYGTVLSQSSLATFTTDISSGNLRLLVSPVNAVTTVKVV